MKPTTLKGSWIFSILFILVGSVTWISLTGFSGKSAVTTAGAAVASGSPRPRIFGTELGHESVENVFIVGHAPLCAEERSLAQYLQESDSLVLPTFDGKDVIVASLAANHSLLRNPKYYDEQFHNTSHFHVALKDLRLEHRRDLLMAALELAVQHKRSGLQGRGGGLRRLRGVQERPTLSKAYLSHLEMDIIYGDTLPDHGTRLLASALPCMSFPPEQNMPRYPTHLPQQPDDLRENWKGEFDQWHLVGPSQGEIAGTSALDGWACVTGQEVPTVVGIVDTGCSMHPDLEHNLCKPTEACAGYDFGDDDDNPYDEPLSVIHGTSVAGAVAAVTNNRYGLAGICWGCRISCFKVWNTRHSSMSIASIIQAIDSMIAKGIRISNHSYIAYGSSSAEKSAHERLEAAGHIVIVAAGNDNCNLDLPYSHRADACKSANDIPLGPAIPVSFGTSNMIAAGSINRKGEKSWFTSWSTSLVHLMAPGENLLLLSNTLREQSGVCRTSGTSFTAPIVTGAAALIWSRAPHLTYTQVKSLILDNTDYDDSYKALCMTSGRLNIAKALRAMNLPCNSPDVATVPTPRQDNTATYYADNSASQLSITASLLLSLLSASCREL